MRRYPARMDDDTRISRRATLAKLGGLVPGALAVGGLKAADSLGALDEEAAGSGPAGVASGAVRCVLAPEQTEGPFFLDDAKVRRNITEGKAGVPLTLRLAVVDVSTCKPIKGAVVDVWHCDAGGVYSGTSTQDTLDDRFLRGVQRTNSKGVALFSTVYPGWYPGRTVHIHVMVHLGGNIVHTGQLYFADAVTDIVYKRRPYASRPSRNPRNVGDSIYRNGGKRSTLKLARSGSGYVGSITMGVQRS